MLNGNYHFEHIPLNIRIKIAIRTCVHGNIKEPVVLDLIKEQASLIKDKSIEFLIQDFIKFNLEEVNTMTKTLKEEVKEIKHFYGLDQKSVIKKGFDIWIDDLSYDINKRISSNKVPPEVVADIFVTDFLCAINNNKNILVDTFTNDMLLKSISGKLLKKSANKLLKDTNQLKDLQIDHPWISVNLESAIEILN